MGLEEVGAEAWGVGAVQEKPGDRPIGAEGRARNGAAAGGGRQPPPRRLSDYLPETRPPAETVLCC